MTNLIDYNLIAQVSRAYEDKGFKRIEVPWWATEEIINVTKPQGCSTYKLNLNDKCLLASGEQSFLYLMNKGQLVPGFYQTITPCFREETYDVLHSKHFMKLELISVEPKYAIDDLEFIKKTVNSVLEQYIKDIFFVETRQSYYDKTIIAGSKTYDLVTKINDEEVELGSYGIRKAQVGTWVYGTGIAEPRSSKVIRMKNN